MPVVGFDIFRGISDSKWSGIKGAFFKCVGIDIHSTPGRITVNQKLTKDSGSTVDTFCRVRLSTSNGHQLWFSYTSGKIYLRNSSGTWSLIYTTVPGAGSAGILGAAEYNGYIYWATQSRVHRTTLADVTAFASVTLNWATFDKTDSEYHPMLILNGSLFIGDANQMAKIDSAATFTSNALDLVAPLRVRTITDHGNEMLIGTIIASNVNDARVIRWDCVRESWQYEDIKEEVGVNAFFRVENTVVAQVGVAGNLYQYDGESGKLFPYKKIPGTWTPTQYGEVYPQAVAHYRGIPVFGLSNSPAAANSTGNPADQGIYTLGNYSKDYPRVLNGPEWIISQDKVASIEIGAILVEGNDLYVSWKDGSNFGVDKLDYTAKYASAYLETLVVIPDQYVEGGMEFPKVFANYESLLGSSSVTFSYKDNHAASYTSMTTVIDSINNRLYAELSVKARVYQLKVAFTVDSNNAPVLEFIGIHIQD